MSDRTRPLLVYDGACGFCRASLVPWRRLVGDAVDAAPAEEVAELFSERPVERFRTAVQLREPGGRWSEGAEAVFRSLALAGRFRLLAALYARSRTFARASEWAYRIVARHRRTLSRLVRSR